MPRMFLVAALTYGLLGVPVWVFGMMQVRELIGVEMVLQSDESVLADSSVEAEPLKPEPIPGTALTTMTVPQFRGPSSVAEGIAAVNGVSIDELPQALKPGLLLASIQSGTAQTLKPQQKAMVKVWNPSLDERKEIIRKYLWRVCPPALAHEKDATEEDYRKLMQMRSYGEIIRKVKAELQSHYIWTPANCPNALAEK